MTKIKLTKLVLISLLIIGLSDSCKTKKQVQHNDENLYGEEWKLGKATFYNYCSACHTPRVKDEIFKSFNARDRGKTKQARVKNLADILRNDNHMNKNIGHENLTQKEIEELLLYIETPQNRATIAVGK